MYVSYGGNSTRKQMFSNLITTHLGDDVVVLSIDGNASVVGFRVFLGNTINFNSSMVDAEDALVFARL